MKLAEDEEAERGVRGMIYGWQEVNESLRTYEVSAEVRTED